MQEKFSLAQAARLRSELLQSGLDCFQAAEAIKMFLAEHGYGISPEAAREVAFCGDALYRSEELFHRQLETVALVM